MARSVIDYEDFPLNSKYTTIMTVLFILILTFSVKALALTDTQFQNNVSQLDYFFKEQNYRMLVDNTILIGQKNFIDQIYEKQNQVILLKWGIKPLQKSYIGKVVDLGFGFTYCDYTPEGLPYSLYFLDHTEAKIQTLVNSIRKNWINKNSLKIDDEISYSILTTFAFGAQALADSNFCLEKGAKNLTEFSDELTIDGLKNLAWSCSAAVKRVPLLKPKSIWIILILKIGLR